MGRAKDFSTSVVSSTAMRHADAEATARHLPLRSSASSSASTLRICLPGRVIRARVRISVYGTAPSRSTATRVVRMPSGSPGQCCNACVRIAAGGAPCWNAPHGPHVCRVGR